MSKDNKEIELSTHEQAPVKKNSPHFWLKASYFFTALTIIALLLSFGYAGRQMLVLHKQFAGQFHSLELKLNEARELGATSQTAITELTDQFKTQQASVEQLQKAQHTNVEDITLVQIETAIRAANRYLQIENDVQAAIKILQLADADLAKLNDTKVFPLREALTADLAKLKGIVPIDLSGTYLKLAAINTELDNLPLIKQFVNEEQEPLESTDKDLPWWKRFRQSAEHALKHIVIIRKNRINVPPFIAPEQVPYFYQNLHMEIEHAEWALLNHNQKVYAASLQQTLAWIKQFTVYTSPITQQIVTEITTLQQLNVQPELPNLSHTLDAFQQYFNHQAGG